MAPQIGPLVSRRARLGERVGDWIADHPRSLPGRVAALRFGLPRAGDVVPVVHAGPASLNVLVAPANYAGQARAWCAALEALDPDIGARNYAIEGPFGFEADAVLPSRVYHNSRRWQLEQFEAARGFSHLLVESFMPPFGRLHGRDLDRQLDALGQGVSVAYLCHGSDIRRPSLALTRTALASHVEDRAARRREELALRHLELLSVSSRPVFVSTPDLLQDVPRATWCPVVVDPDRWALRRSTRPGRVRVVHAPSKAAAKGSSFIEPVLEELAAAGMIEYIAARGVPHERMPQLFASADIVVDQLSVGSYGVAACEAMAAGCAVVSHVTPEVRRIVREHTDVELPIVEASPDTLADVIAHLATDEEERRSAGARGTEFIREIHDGTRSARMLRDSWIGEG
jgi:hypothetical protein